ncbi:TonB-dependent receptor [Flavobacterium sp. NST-5]|uniref:TonB-dependent receptor n=1 Tax=Flavobacterium ichthyis TaxID=2698827 RepID=A0ABW9Z863_9FLAO|nr:TonB-dependent receptor [Flavobacterium ichthyis]NBL65063.1 TonB-dependent receptor [Flavobacterium ichthyis]
MRIFQKAVFPLSLFFTLNLLAQETFIDSTKITQIDEVVVTGQFEPQSLKKSVHNVRVISKEEIKSLAANNLGDVLNQYLNISIRTSGSDGRSSVSMFGLDSQYFKILVDNIPLVSDTGLGTNIDLTQVNLDDIEQIEIIEGSMGVTHGANAVSGILNIITKKNSRNKWEIVATVQEETVSDEFAFFDQGRHIQAFKISHQINDDWFASLGANRNDFAGFFDDMEGKEYAVSNGKRGYRQLPKEQINGNAIIGYNKNDFRIFYKFDYFDENVDYYNPVVIPIDNYPFPNTNYAQDRRYITNRYFHHLNSYGKIFKLNYNVSLSHQKQARDIEKFNYSFENDSESANNRETYQSKEVLYSIGTVNNFFTSKWLDLQLGYEFVNESGFYDETAGTFLNDSQQAQDIRKRLENYDVFAVAEINATSRFSIRPGFRYSFQSVFENQYSSSLGLKYLFDNGYELRGAVGRSFRTPNFEELYTYFVDSNHNLQGNENLVPETSMSYEVSAKKKSRFDSGVELASNAAITYMTVDDRISMVLTQVTPMLAYRYENIDQYKMWNFATNHQFAYKNWNAKVGLSYVGISQKIDLAAQNASSDDNYLYSLQMNSSVSYNVPKWNTLFSIFYKYNGKQQQYVATTNASGDAQFSLAELESYGWMDASVRKSFFNNKFEITAGARNILDITTVQQTTGANGVHSVDGTLLLGYGRSYFLKLTYNLNFN